MSHVTLLAADRPLPLYDSGARRVRTVSRRGQTVRVEEDGFSVRPNDYYRGAVEEQGFPMKPHRYELSLRATQQDAALLGEYLRQHLRPGETAQLWSVWVPRHPEDRLTRYRGRLEDLDLEAITPLEGWNVCITVER